MTAQIPDTFLFADSVYSFTKVNGGSLFNPTDIGLRVGTISTACRRGNYCEYAVTDNLLKLTKLSVRFDEEHVRFAEAGLGPRHFGLIPQRDAKEAWVSSIDVGSLVCEGTDLDVRVTTQTVYSDWYYAPLTYVVDFSGDLLLAREYTPENDDRRRRRFRPACDFLDVHELIFEHGHLVEARDCRAGKEAAHANR